ncbi:hypothetical protein ACT3SZ_10900 [Corynebacterium sp. AOP40-9SA-29]|uniref:hypothetical protein n=1 Tax=Corynebacterium sp. AOP40-9SA-29 TaxID=3457677 RepID=UPI004034D360
MNALGLEGELVLDTGPLSHLAEAQWLSILRSVAGRRRIVIPEAVASEIRNGLHANPHLRHVIDAGWIVVLPMTSPEELKAYGRFAERLVVGSRNVGEAAVLAYAHVHGAVAVIDDGAGRKAGRDAGVTVQPTLALLCQAIREGLLTVPLVSDLADHLLETEYRLPFAQGGFQRWAEDNGLLFHQR